MAYVAPPMHNPGDLITAADWNQYIRDNWGSLTNLVAYSSNGAALSGWTEFTGARGFFIVGLVSGGEAYAAAPPGTGTVGTALTNKQNITHTHTITHTGWTRTTNDGSLPNRINISGDSAGVDVASAANTSGTASAGSIGMPYIQLMCITKS